MGQTNSRNVRSTRTDSRPVRLFHKLAVLVVLAGAAASLGFMLYKGRHNESVVLILLFVGWVVSPFIAMLLINTVSNRWSLAERLSLYGVMIFVTLGSLVMYSGLWNPPDVRPAFAFLVGPLLSWFVLGVAGLTATFAPNR